MEFKIEYKKKGKVTSETVPCRNADASQHALQTVSNFHHGLDTHVELVPLLPVGINPQNKINALNIGFNELRKPYKVLDKIELFQILTFIFNPILISLKLRTA